MVYGSLTITMADGSTRTVLIDRPTLRIGRSPDNDLVIDDPSVSSYHARIFADADGVAILDIGSRNGTEVDGRTIETLAPLSPASRVKIGGARLGLLPPGAMPAAPDEDDPFAGLPPAAAAAPPPAVSAAAVAPGGAAARAEGPPLVRMELTPAAAVADLGSGAPAILSFSLTVQNLSRFIDRILLSAEAPPWATVTIDPPEHALQPGTSGTSRVQIVVARSPASSAGEHRVDLVARSEKRPDLRFAADAALTVLPFTEFRVELLEPRARTGWLGGRFQVQVANQSNRALPFTLEGRDDDSVIRFAFEPEPLEVEPGARQVSELRARFKLMRLFGQPKTYNFNVAAEPFDESAPEQLAAGRLILRPPLPPWALISSAVLALLATLLLCVTLAFRGRDQIAGLVRGLFALPSPTALVATATPEPTIDVGATVTAVAAGAAAEQAAVNTALAETAAAAAQQNAETQTAVAEQAASTQAALATGAAATQTQAASSVAATQTVQATQVVATQASGGTQAAGTATAQANATGTALAATGTALAATQTALAAPPIGPATGQVITFDRVGGVAVNTRLPVRGDEYAGQDAFFCFYQPFSLSGGRGRPPGLARPAAQTSSTLTVSDVSQSEGNAGTTNFVFTITWTANNIEGNAPLVLTVDYRTSDGGALPPGGAPATSPADYLPISGTAVIQIPPDGTFGQATVAVAVVGDTLFEPNEVFSLTVSNPQGAFVELLDPIGTGAILNDDQPPTLTPTATTVPSPTSTAIVPPTVIIAPPVGDLFECRPPVPAGTGLNRIQGVIYPPPVRAANNGPQHSQTSDVGENELVSNAIAVINFQRNVSEVNVDLWYPGSVAATYVLFAFDERGELIASARRDAIGVPANYQLNVRSVERPIRQIVIEARPGFAGEFSSAYRFEPVVPPLLTRVELRYTSP